MSTVVQGCACGCRRPLGESWHLLSPECFALLSNPVRAELEESCGERVGSRRHIEAMKAAIREVRQFRFWRMEVEAWKAKQAIAVEEKREVIT